MSTLEMYWRLPLQMPKLKLLLGAALGRDWEEHEVLLPPEELTDAQAARYRAYRRAVEQERCMDPLRVSKCVGEGGHCYV
jgi:hypothetical protein